MSPGVPVVSSDQVIGMAPSGSTAVKVATTSSPFSGYSMVVLSMAWAWRRPPGSRNSRPTAKAARSTRKGRVRRFFERREAAAPPPWSASQGCLPGYSPIWGIKLGWGLYECFSSCLSILPQYLTSQAALKPGFRVVFSIPEHRNFGKEPPAAFFSQNAYKLNIGCNDIVKGRTRA